MKSSRRRDCGGPGFGQVPLEGEATRYSLAKLWARAQSPENPMVPPASVITGGATESEGTPDLLGLSRGGQPPRFSVGSRKGRRSGSIRSRPGGREGESAKELATLRVGVPPLRGGGRNKLAPLSRFCCEFRNALGHRLRTMRTIGPARAWGHASKRCQQSGRGHEAPVGVGPRRRHREHYE